MPNEFIIKNGFQSQGTSNLTGSFSVNPSASIAGSVLNTNSYILSYLSGSGYQQTINWSNKQLTHYSTGSDDITSTVDWELGYLRRDVGVFSRISVNWFDQSLRYGNGSTISLNWSNNSGYLVDIYGSTQLQDGSHSLTGSLQISGSIIGQSGNTVTSDALLQATLLYLSNNF